MCVVVPDAASAVFWEVAIRCVAAVVVGYTCAQKITAPPGRSGEKLKLCTWVRESGDERGNLMKAFWLSRLFDGGGGGGLCFCCVQGGRVTTTAVCTRCTNTEHVIVNNI